MLATSSEREGQSHESECYDSCQRKEIRIIRILHELVLVFGAKSCHLNLCLQCNLHFQIAFLQLARHRSDDGLESLSYLCWNVFFQSLCGLITLTKPWLVPTNG